MELHRTHEGKDVRWVDGTKHHVDSHGSWRQVGEPETGDRRRVRRLDDQARRGILEAGLSQYDPHEGRSRAGNEREGRKQTIEAEGRVVENCPHVFM